MNSFKKYQLISEPVKSNNDVYSSIKYQTPVNVSRLSDLDRDIGNILNQEVEFDLKIPK